MNKKGLIGPEVLTSGGNIPVWLLVLLAIGLLLLGIAEFVY